MAYINEGFAPTQGQASDLSFYERNGRVVMRSAHNKRTDKGRTPKAMAARTRMSNVNMAWRVLGPALKGCFELPRKGLYEYNVFMSANTASARVFLTKEQSVAQYFVADNFTVGSGSLQPAIQVESTERHHVSDIAVGPGPIDLRQGFGRLAERIVRYNGGAFRYGDTLLFVGLRQYEGVESYAPYCTVLRDRAVLDLQDSRPIGQVWPLLTPEGGMTVVDGRLAMERQAGTLVAWVRLRKGEHGEQLATTQTLVGDNPLLERFTSWEAREAAIRSYGPLKAPQSPNDYLMEPYVLEQYPELKNQ